MSLTDRDRKIVIAIIPLILVAVYWFMILAPKRKEAHKLAAQVTTAQQARDAAVSQATTLEQAKTKFAAQYAQMVRLGKAIPTQVDMPSLLVQLNAAARGTGIQFGDMKVGARVAAAPVSSGTTTPSTPSTGTTGATGTTGPTGSTAPPVAAGGATAQTAFGQAVESANNAAAKGNAQAAKESQPAVPLLAPGTAVPGLDTVPLTFTFGGKFSNLAQFFHRLKRFVHVANSRIRVQGRLITIDSLKFTSTAANFPDIEADVSATVYLSPKDGGATGGATSAGPAATTPGAVSNASAAAAAVTPPTSAITR
ncbi:MAG TPA: type 4a pilus biogenesis protein PilO [Thermoleophilaceae bacterium]